MKTIQHEGWRQCGTERIAGFEIGVAKGSESGGDRATMSAKVSRLAAAMRNVDEYELTLKLPA